jgi:hypothetical protein
MNNFNSAHSFTEGSELPPYEGIKEKLKKHLESGCTITPLEALSKFHCFRLAVYIDRLRKDGMNIHTEMVKENGKQFARYSI